jgi:hypothetical protein
MRDEIRFRATVEAARGGGHVVEVDPAIAGRVGAKHRTRVRGSIAGAAYRSNLASTGGRLVLGVHKATLEVAGKEEGDTVSVTMALDTQTHPNDEVPEVLARALRRNPAARKAWASMPPSHRREYVGYITEAKRPDTRERRTVASIARVIEWAKTR